jgi:hypothetical protein
MDSRGRSLIALAAASILLAVPTDGASDESPSPNAANIVGVRGEYLRAFTVAYDNVLKRHDVSTGDKQLDHYDVDLGESNGHDVVVFRPRVAPGESRGLGGRTSLGVDMIYYINPTTYKITMITGLH